MSRAPRSLLSNTFASGAAIGWTAVVTLGLTPFLIRQLGASAYGVWVLLTVVLVQGRGLASLVDLGLQQSLIQRIAAAEDPEEASRRLGAGLRILAVMGAASAAVLAATAAPIAGLFRLPSHLESSMVTALRILAVQLLFDVPAVAFASALEGLRRYELRRVVDSGRVTLFGLLAVGAALRGWGVTGLALASLISAFAFAVAVALACRAAGLWVTSGGRLRDELRSGRPLMALRATGVVYRQLDKLILGAIVGTVATAGFDVADKVNMAALTVVGVATSALIPAAAEGMRTDPDRTRRLVLTATRWSALAAMPLAGLAIGVATPLAHLLAGRTISGTDAAIRWLALATALAVVVAAAFEMGIGAGAARRIAPISLAGLVVNVVATVILARSYGLPGSAAASTIAIVFELPLIVHVLADVFSHARRRLLAAAAPGWALGIAVAAASFAFSGSDKSVAALARGTCAGAVVTLVAGAVLAYRARSSLFSNRRDAPTAS